MRYYFLISVGAAVLLPVLLISFFAGASVLFAFLQWFALIVLVGIILFYLLGASAKTAVSKMGAFENSLWLTTLILKFTALFDLIFAPVAAFFAVLILEGNLGKNLTPETPFGKLIIISAPLLVFFALLAFFGSIKLNKLSKLGYFMALPVSFFHIFVLIGIFPLWFLTRYRREYFAR